MSVEPRCRGWGGALSRKELTLRGYFLNSYSQGSVHQSRERTGFSLQFPPRGGGICKPSAVILAWIFGVHFLLFLEVALLVLNQSRERRAHVWGNFAASCSRCRSPEPPRNSAGDQGHRVPLPWERTRES